MAFSAKNKRTNPINEERHILSEKSPFAVQEAYKALRTGLIFSTAEEGCQVILVTSSEQGETKSTTAVNLALSFVQNKSRVLLIDCDLRLPTVAAKLKVPATPGLTDMLVGRAKASEAIRRLPSGLYVLPAGTLPPNPSELLGSRTMGLLVEQMKPNFDQIILDSPPIIALSDSMVLTPYSSGVVLVTRQGVTSVKELRTAIQKLEFADARIYGLVLTGNKMEKHRGSRKGYGYNGYSYERKAAP